MKVAFYGRIGRSTGYAAASRAYIHALHRAGVDVAVVDLDAESTVDDPIIAPLMQRRAFEPDFHIVHYLPHASIPLALHAERLIVATVWEADAIPRAWVKVLNRAREVWVPCEHNVAAFARAVEPPVFKWPHAVTTPGCHGPGAAVGCAPCANAAAASAAVASTACCDPSRLPALGDRDFVFYSIFVWHERKHPLGMIEAFSRAFPPHTRHVRLVLKIRGGPPRDRLAALLGPAAANIDIIDADWTDAQIEALSRRGQCYLSLHRGEGWGYPLFNAACRGTPVIATNYSGPVEYLSPRDHGLVAYRLIHVDRPDHAGFDPAMRWADPDLDHAAQLMRYVHVHHDTALQRARGAAERLRRQFSLEAIGEAARGRLAQLL